MKLKYLASAAALALTLVASGAQAEDAAKLNDLEIAHVAYTADNADIRYAHLALAKSKNTAVRKFAQSMISDHNKVNELAPGPLEEAQCSTERQLPEPGDQRPRGQACCRDVQAGR